MGRSRQSARDRGNETQRLLAGWYRKIWPHVQPVGSGSPGRDLLSVPVSVEAKARTGFDPMNWVKQARGRRVPEDEFPPWAVMRCNGQGEAALPEWIVLMALEDHTDMVKELIWLRQWYRDSQPTVVPREYGTVYVGLELPDGVQEDC